MHKKDDDDESLSKNYSYLFHHTQNTKETYSNRKKRIKQIEKKKMLFRGENKGKK